MNLDFRLTCDPEIILEEDDIVDVVHEGETFKLVVGTSFNYITNKVKRTRSEKYAF